MSSELNYPFLVFALSFVSMSLGAWAGFALLRKRGGLEDEAREHFGVVLGATLTLLALLVGFSFSMAIQRYDQRKNYEEAEANAIGTEMVRAGLLPPADAAKVRALLKSYVDLRIAFYTTRDPQALRDVNARTAQLQGELWSAVEGPALAQPNPVVALAVAGMNDVLNSQGYTQAAWWNRIPHEAWALMAFIAIACNVLVGYGARSARGAGILLLILPLIVAVAFELIADIDSPRSGLIHVVPQNLRSLQGLPPAN
jgi:hypothetical protein